MTTAHKKRGGEPRRTRAHSVVSTNAMEHSSQDSPCPICDRTKDRDCAWTSDKGLVLCYTEGKDGNPAQSANGYHFNGQYSDSYHGANTSAQYVKKKPSRSTSNRKPTARAKSTKQKNKDASLAAAEVESEVMHMAIQVIEGILQPAQAHNKLSAWCKEHGHNDFHASQLLKEELANARELGTEVASDEDPRWMREYRLLEKKFGDHLRFNELTKQVELDGKAFDANTAKLQLGINHNTKLKGNREDLADSVVMLAQKNSYSPVGEYLRAVHQEYGDSTAILDGLAARHLGTSDPMHEALLRRFLIAAVARAIAPGCKHDCALILQGPQGYYKSTFFKVLASEPWFDDSLGSASDKDEKLKLHRSWIVEWAELETVFRRRDVSQVKAFMSSAVDILRPPYGRSIETLKRASVIVGTTNQDQFLADTTGNRRFWVIPITRPIDFQKLRAERNRIWAAAFALYQTGEQWWLTSEENQKVDAARSQYESVDPWLNPVHEYVDGRDAVTTEAILEMGLDLDKGKHNSGHARRVADIMRKLGWQQTPNKVSHYGKRKRVWKMHFP